MPSPEDSRQDSERPEAEVQGRAMPEAALSGKWPRPGDDRQGIGRGLDRDDRAGVNTDLFRLVAAAADLCRRPLRHAVIDGSTASGTTEPMVHGSATDRCLHLVVRTLQGERRPEEDLELEIYRSGTDLNLTLAWLACEERPVLWHGSHPVWMDGTSGERCERPEGGSPLEALARRLRALLAHAQDPCLDGT